MADFNESFEKILQHEGGYSNDPADRGGETVFGISRVFHPDWKGWKVLSKIKESVKSEFYNDPKKYIVGNFAMWDLVKEFYMDKFWIKLHLDSFDQQVANEIFDTSVNQGLLSGPTYFQQALNRLNRQERDYENIEVDGDIGHQTISAYKALIKTERFRYRDRDKIIKVLLKWMNYYQMKRYDNIMEHDEEQELFAFGWTDRV